MRQVLLNIKSNGFDSAKIIAVFHALVIKR